MVLDGADEAPALCVFCQDIPNQAPGMALHHLSGLGMWPGAVMVLTSRPQRDDAMVQSLLPAARGGGGGRLAGGLLSLADSGPLKILPC
jgi:hypothetical protein